MRLAASIERALREAEEKIDRKRLEEELQSEKMASVGQLVSGVAHELNNPLTGVMGFAQLLLTRDLEDTVRAQIQDDLRARPSAPRKIVQNLLSFARKHEHQVVESNLNTLVLEMLDLEHRLRCGITLEQDLAAGLPSLLVDPHQLQQVLLNLLNNAEQAMEKTKGGLRVETRAEGTRVVLRVRDSGPGISAENLALIFDPFFTTKEPGKGTGLGLSIVAKIVKEHGGTLSVDSKPGAGACFTVSLPAMGAEADAAPAAAAGEPPGCLPARRREGGPAVHGARAQADRPRGVGLRQPRGSPGRPAPGRLRPGDLGLLHAGHDGRG